MLNYFILLVYQAEVHMSRGYGEIVSCIRKNRPVAGGGFLYLFDFNYEYIVFCYVLSTLFQ